MPIEYEKFEWRLHQIGTNKTDLRVTAYSVYEGKRGKQEIAIGRNGMLLVGYGCSIDDCLIDALLHTGEQWDHAASIAAAVRFKVLPV